MGWRAAARAHPRHLALGALVAGLVLSNAAAPAAIGAVAALLLAAVVTRSTLLALAVAALVIAGALAGTERRQAIDRTRLGPWMGHDVAARGFVARRERTAGREQRMRVRLTSLQDPGGRSRPIAELIQVRTAREGHFPDAAVGDELLLQGALEQ